MISVEEAKSIVESSFSALGDVRITLLDSIGRVISEDVVAPISLPPFRQSAMDGYAIRLEDAGSPLKLQGVVKAGDTNVPELKVGYALRIFTGAMVPTSANAVVMQEKVNASENEVSILDSNLREQMNIRPVGEQINEGEVALKKGTVMNPGVIGYAASFGFTSVPVIKTPSLAMAVTGDELIQPGGELETGKIFESNSITIHSVAKETGYNIESLKFIKDDFQATKNEIKELVNAHDVLLLTGGISVGDYDFVWKSLEELGCEVLFYKVRQKPGKPLLVGKLGNCSVFALPGNPYAALSCYYQYVLPALDLLSGKKEVGLTNMSLPMKEEYLKNGDRAEFLKAMIVKGEVVILGKQASSMLASFTDANAIAYIPENINELKVGDLVEIGLL